MFFKNIDICNFRGIESLSMSNVKQVNLITGRNNCGKTSILEALFLLTGMSNPQLALNIHAFRDIFLTDDAGLSCLFRNCDHLNNMLNIKGTLDSLSRVLDIKPIYSDFTHITKQDSEKTAISKNTLISSASDNIQNYLTGIAFCFTINNQKSFRSELELKHNDIILNISREYQEKITATFINSKTIMADIDRRLDAILVRKELDVIINALREIEPRLSDIRMGARGMIYADIGIEKMIPINLMGDGIRRILSILSVISETKNGVVLIDEIENGLHYTTLLILWKTVLQAAHVNNVQLFVTTHSYECIEAMTHVYKYKEFDFQKDMISLFRIDRKKDNQHQAVQYEADALVLGIEKEFELR